MSKEPQTTPHELLFRTLIKTSTLGRDDRDKAWREAIAEALDAEYQRGLEDGRRDWAVKG